MSESVGVGEGDAPARMRGRVKWFNAVKGYGFVTPEDSSGDVFLHMTVLRQAGLDTIPVGSTVEYETVRAAKGLQVQTILSVDHSTAVAEDDGGEFHRPVRAAPHAPPRQPEAHGDFEMATVKWFNPNKGYGFVCPDETQLDVFIHMVTLRRANLSGLVTGQKVMIKTAQGQKGMQAVEIKLAGPGSVDQFV